MPTDTKVTTFFKVKSLYDLLLTLRPHASHSASSLLLWNILRETIECLMKRLDNLDSANIVEAELIRRYGEISDNLHFYLGFLEAGEANRIPSVMISPLQAILEKQGVSAKVVVWSGWIPSNYSVGPSLGIRLKQHVLEVFENPEDPVVESVPMVLAALSFPAAERDNILLHSALGHELGHVLAAHRKDINAYTKQKPVRLDDTQLRAAVRRATDQEGVAGDASSSSLDLFLERDYELLKAAAMKVAYRWLNELLADAYSVFFLGPAPVLSLHCLAGVPGPSSTHPPGSLRFPVMLQCLKLSGFWETDDPEVGWLVGRLAEVHAACEPALEPVDPVSEIVYNCLRQHVDSIASYAMESGTEYSKPYSYGEWTGLYLPEPGNCGTRNALVNRILNYVIPDCIDGAGDDSPADLASILNAGWTVFYAHWEEFCRGLEAADLVGQHRARQKLFNLLLKAVEAVDLKQRWARSHDIAHPEDN